MQLQMWLDRLKNIHIKEMDLSLERVEIVANRLNLKKSPCPLITVAGTNGKGSTVAALQAIYQAAGYKVGAYTSPYLFRYQEQIALTGSPASEEMIIQAFEEIQTILGEMTLTAFEFSTLAALLIFKKTARDIWILEVGLGGRYDAVNILPADVAIVTSIALDHMEWLGSTREHIGYEKAGIFKPNCFAICGDFDPPASLIHYAETIKAPLWCQKTHFGFKKKNQSWDFWSQRNTILNLPLPSLALQNMASALMAVELLQEKLAVPRSSIEQGLQSISLRGRIQVVEGPIQHIFDVSHNPASVALLAEYLKSHPIQGKTIALFSMLGDKDIEGSLQAIQNYIDHWYVAALQETSRAASVDRLMTAFKNRGLLREMISVPNLKEGYFTAKNQASTKDRLVIFGSFHTVAETYSLL